MTSHALFFAARAAANNASALAAVASKAASEAAVALANALDEHTASEESERRNEEGSDEIIGIAPTFYRSVQNGSESLGKPTAAADVMVLVSALSPKRAVRRRGVSGDCLRVGFALKNNEGLLKAAGRAPEAEVMATLYDLFCMRSPETYPGRRATVSEYAGFSRPSAITIDTLVMMADEDRVSAAADAVELAEMSESASDSINLAGSARNSLPKWLEANLEVTADPSDIVTQFDILSLMRDPDKGWKFAGRHKAKKIKLFLKSWFDSKRVYYGDDKYKLHF